MIRKETDGKHFDSNTGKCEPIYCPANGWDCPYYEKGICYIRDPMQDCDDWGNVLGIVGRMGEQLVLPNFARPET